MRGPFKSKLLDDRTFLEKYSASSLATGPFKPKPPSSWAAVFDTLAARAASGMIVKHVVFAHDSLQGKGALV